MSGGHFFRSWEIPVRVTMKKSRRVCVGIFRISFAGIERPAPALPGRKSVRWTFFQVVGDSRTGHHEKIPTRLCRDFLHLSFTEYRMATMKNLTKMDVIAHQRRSAGVVTAGNACGAIRSHSIRNIPKNEKTEACCVGECRTNYLPGYSIPISAAIRVHCCSARSASTRNTPPKSASRDRAVYSA